MLVHPSVIATLALIGSVSLSAATLFCPASDGAVYTISSTRWQVECGLDHAGGDMSAPNGQHASNLEACIQRCSARSGCVNVACVNGNGACYMKSVVGKDV